MSSGGPNMMSDFTGIKRMPTSGGTSAFIPEFDNFGTSANDDAQRRANTTYHIDFRLHYKRDGPGMKMCCFGKIPELSMWDKSKPLCWLKEVEDDIWVPEKPVVTN